MFMSCCGWLGLGLGIIYVFVSVIRSKMKIEDIKEANKALQVE